MTINVTQEHIDKGNRSACRDCPVFHATDEATGKRFPDLRKRSVDLTEPASWCRSRSNSTYRINEVGHAGGR